MRLTVDTMRRARFERTDWPDPDNSDPRDEPADAVRRGATALLAVLLGAPLVAGLWVALHLTTT